MRNKITNSIKTFFYGPTSPIHLAVLRIALCGNLLWMCWDFPLWTLTQVPDALYNPVGLFKWLNIPNFSHAVVEKIQISWHVTLGLSCLGVATRFSTKLAFILGFYMMGFRGQFGDYSHIFPPLIFMMFVLAFSHCGAALSVDSYIKSRFRPEKIPRSGNFRWPVRLAQFIWVSIFFCTALSKLRDSGFDWISGESMKNHILWSRYVYYGTGDFWEIVPQTFDFPVFGLLAGLGLSIEFAAPLAFINKYWVRLPVVGSIAILQVGILFFFGYSHLYWYLPLYLAWVDWEKISLFFQKTFRGEISRSNSSLE